MKEFIEDNELCQRCEKHDEERLNLLLMISLFEKEIRCHRNPERKQGWISLEQKRDKHAYRLLSECKELLIQLQHGEPVSDHQLQQMIQSLTLMEV